MLKEAEVEGFSEDLQDLPEIIPKKDILFIINSVQFSCLVVSDCCNHMNRSMPGLPVHHQLREFTQTHVHQVSDAICWGPAQVDPGNSKQGWHQRSGYNSFN